jgi:carboxyl-terminal processing protease
MVLRGMVASLNDGHTSFLTPDEARRRQETSFAGIGVLLSRPQDDQPPLIAEIFPNSPAAGSGLKRGDRILAVDSNDVTGKAVGDIAQLIRGPRGTDVQVRVKRLSAQAPLDYTLKRAVVQVEQVIGRQVPNAPIGYLRIRNFNDDNVVQQVLGILDQGRQRGLRGWVVDLRGNPGGALRAVIKRRSSMRTIPCLGYQVDRQRRQTPLETQSANLTAARRSCPRSTTTAPQALRSHAALQEAKIAQLVGTRTAATSAWRPDYAARRVGSASTEQRFVSPARSSTRRRHAHAWLSYPTRTLRTIASTVGARAGHGGAANYQPAPSPGSTAGPGSAAATASAAAHAQTGRLVAARRTEQQRCFANQLGRGGRGDVRRIHLRRNLHHVQRYHAQTSQAVQELGQLAKRHAAGLGAARTPRMR